MSDTLSGTLETDSFPMRAIITDDPLRIKMLAAHHLDNAVIKHEQGDELVYTGNYRQPKLKMGNCRTHFSFHVKTMNCYHRYWERNDQIRACYIVK